MTDLVDRIVARKAKIVVIGQGYVGLPLAVRASEVGFSVTGFDLDAGKVSSLCAGVSYVGDVTDERLGRALASGFNPTADPSDLSGFDIAVISVPTPLVEGRPDLSFIEAAGLVLATHLRPGACVVLESTTYPGTTEELLAPLLEKNAGLTRADYFLGYSPERVDPGNARFPFEVTPKVVSGDRAESLAVIAEFFSLLVSEVVPVATCAEAEMTKLLENTFRHVNIALVNELARYAFELDIDVWRVIDAAATKPFGFMRFEPGPGVGGHCLPIDPTYLAWKVREHLGYSFRFVELANDVNDHMPEYVVGRLTQMLNEESRSVKGSRIVLLGLAYKAGTGDWRESPSAKIANQLSDLGALVSICDPHVDPSRSGDYASLLVPFSEASLRDSDLVVLLVGHPEFDPELIASNASLILDTRNILRGVEFTGEVL